MPVAEIFFLLIIAAIALGWLAPLIVGIRGIKRWTIEGITKISGSFA